MNEPKHFKHRETARVILHTAARTESNSRLLLLYTAWDPGSGLPPRWVIPGGGVDPGESVEATAVREVFEETGLAIEPARLSKKRFELAFREDWATGVYETGLAHYFSHEVSEPFEPDRSLWTAEEHRDVLDVRWWKLSDIEESNERFGPRGLREALLDPALSPFLIRR